MGLSVIVLSIFFLDCLFIGFALKLVSTDQSIFIQKRYLFRCAFSSANIHILVSFAALHSEMRMIFLYANIQCQHGHNQACDYHGSIGVQLVNLYVFIQRSRKDAGVGGDRKKSVDEVADAQSSRCECDEQPYVNRENHDSPP